MDLGQLSSYVAAETMRRQVLEEVLFEKSKLLGGLDKEEFEKRFKAKAEAYKKEMKEAAEAQRAANEKAKEEEKAKPKIYGADGRTPIESKGQ